MAPLTLSPCSPAQPALGAMYAVYKQAHPPTGLEFSMYCNFFNNSERNLVVAGTSQLYVYRLNRDAEVGPAAPAAVSLPTARRGGCPVARHVPRLPPLPVLAAAAWLRLQRAPAGLEPSLVHLTCSLLFSKLNDTNACCVRGSRNTLVNKTCKNGAGNLS